MAKPRVSLSFGLTLLILSFLLAAPGLAQVAKRGKDLLSSLAFSHAQLPSAAEVELLDDVRAVTAKSMQDGWEAFRIGAGPTAEWQAWIDKRSGLVSFAEGGNVPWIPGHGNRMTAQDLSSLLKAKPGTGPGKIDLDVMDAIARSFLPRVQGMLGVDPAQLALNRGRSGQVASYLWFVDYDVVRDGLPIEGARVLFRVNNGNLIQFGSENLPAPGATVPPTRLTKQQARAAVETYIGGFQKGDTFRDGGSLHLVPAAIPSAKATEGYEIGRGRGLTKVWQLVFHRAGVTGTWSARVDATTGEVVELSDANKYAQVNGGIYAGSPYTGPELVRPMPYADLSTGGFANSAGLYSYSSGTVSSTLQGKYVQVSSYCGLPGHPPISQASASSGDISFGTSPGTTDCATPGTGGPGNTHAAREQFYQLNRAMEVARGWMPANTWLNGPVYAGVDLDPYCQTYWNGTGLSFDSAGSGCTNPGQIAALGFHEFGHALDDNDGTSWAYDDEGTAESYGDTTALIATHDSCIGAGLLGGNCTGYGDACTACTGARDVDWNQHSSHTPATPDNFTRLNCYILWVNAGPCGSEPHCESYVPTEAIWDFANRDLPSPGTSPAWAVLDRLWYLSRSTATQSFYCAGNTSAYTSHGCGAGTLWRVFRAVDDDDGNLSNGTPHGGALYAAFTRHQISCTKDVGASLTFAGCAPPAAPTLTVTPGHNSASLSWTSIHGAVYDVFRNEVGCNSGFARIASGITATSFTDTEIADGLTYYYQVTAYPSGNEACASAPTACVPTTGPDFSLGIIPSTVTLPPLGGTTAMYTVAVNRIGGFPNAVSLSVSGLPPGASVTFVPNPVTGANSVMQVTVPSSWHGTASLTVTGTGGALTHTATALLIRS